MLIDRFKYKASLTELWSKVFKDEKSYIELIFSEGSADSILCFAETDGDKVVSAFYLLKTYLYFNNKCYNGYYLYAAATDNSYRGKGIMSKLIKEAQDCCEKSGSDFISLVPSEASLYSYYKRSGFIGSMYCVEKAVTAPEAERAISADEYYSRRKLQINYFNFDEKSFSYAADCLKAAGFGFFSDKESIYIKDNGGEIIEHISFADAEFADCKKYPFGMLYPINPELNREWKHTDIYMNIALD